MEVHGSQRRCRRLARELELERQRAGCQHRRQPSQPVEREAEWWLGVRQDD
jgi:hypothetical protein